MLGAVHLIADGVPTSKRYAAWCSQDGRSG